MLESVTDQGRRACLSDEAYLGNLESHDRRSGFDESSCSQRTPRMNVKLFAAGHEAYTS